MKNQILLILTLFIICGIIIGGMAFGSRLECNIQIEIMIKNEPNKYVWNEKVIRWQEENKVFFVDLFIPDRVDTLKVR